MKIWPHTPDTYDMRLLRLEQQVRTVLEEQAKLLGLLERIHQLSIARIDMLQTLLHTTTIALNSQTPDPKAE